MQRVAAPPDPPDQAHSHGAGDDSDEEEDADEDAGIYREEDVVLVMEFTGAPRHSCPGSLQHHSCCPAYHSVSVSQA